MDQAPRVKRRMILILSADEVTEGLELGPSAKLVGVSYNPETDSVNFLLHGIGPKVAPGGFAYPCSHREFQARRKDYVPIERS